MNQQLDLSIPVVGEPAPDCKWTLNGQELKSGDNVKVIMMVIMTMKRMMSMMVIIMLQKVMLHHMIDALKY